MTQVSSSLAEVTEILDRHIDNNDDDDNASVTEIDEKNLKRKRISFNVPGTVKFISGLGFSGLG